MRNGPLVPVLVAMTVASVAGGGAAALGFPPVAVGASVLVATAAAFTVIAGVMRSRLTEIVASLRARDFERLPSEDEAEGIFREVRDLGLELRRREREVRAREALLRRVVDAVPMAMVLFAGSGRILTANAAARELFFDGRAAEGENFLSMLRTAPEALRKAIAGPGELVTLRDDEGAEQSLHLAKRVLDLDGEAVVLVLVTNVTRELGRKEVAAWKRVIRVLSHEVNNTLAPLRSLAHSGRILVEGRPDGERLAKILTTVERRADHLAEFLDGYARVARLPEPRPADIDWSALAARVLALFPGARLEGEVPAPAGWGDPAQLEQLLVNLLTNAFESGSAPEDVTLAVVAQGEKGVRLVVADRGRGLSAEAEESALVPFFSTKQAGGIGLALSREIVEAHGGTLRLAPRDGDEKGAVAVVHLPARERPLAPSTLSLSRAGASDA